MTDNEVYDMKVAAERLWVLSNSASDLHDNLSRALRATGRYFDDFFDAQALPVLFSLIIDIADDLRAATAKLDAEVAP